MRPSEAVAQHRQALLEMAHRHGVVNHRVFGSVARGEDAEGSDIDLLVDAPRGTTYFTLARLQDEARPL
jgi:predicted nucleotidyltransferase